MEGQKKVIKNYLYNVSYQILAILVPLITTPYVSRVLGATGVGDYAYTSSIVSYFGFAAVLGTAPYGQREIAFVQGDAEHRSRVFWEVFWLRSSTVLLIGCVYCVFLAFARSYRLLYLIQICTVISWFLDISWFFQGMEEFKITVLRNCAVKLVSVALIFLLVHSDRDVWIYTWILCGSALAGNLTMWPFLKERLVRVSRKDLRPFRHWKSSLEMFLPLVSTQIYLILDQTMLGSIVNTTQVGYYTQTQKILRLESTMLSSLSTVLLPRMAVVLSQDNLKLARQYYEKAVRFGVMLNLPMTVGTMLTAGYIIPLFFGEGYAPCIRLLGIFSILLITQGIGQIAGTMLVAMRRQKEYTASIVIGSVINLLCNGILIPRHGALGATVSSVISEICIEWMQFYAIRREFSWKEIGNAFSAYLFPAAVMGLAVAAARHFLPVSVQSLFLLVILAVLVYGVCLILRKDPMLIGIAGKRKDIE